MDNVELRNLIQTTRSLLTTPIVDENNQPNQKFNVYANRLENDLQFLKKTRRCDALIAAGCAFLSLLLLAALTALLVIFPVTLSAIPRICVIGAVAAHGIGMAVSFFSQSHSAHRLIKKMEPIKESINSLRCG